MKSSTSTSTNTSSNSTTFAGLSLEDLLRLETTEEGLSFLRHIKQNPHEVGWTYFGGERNNAGNIELTSKPSTGLMERLTNGMDAYVKKANIEGEIPDHLTSPREVGQHLIQSFTSTPPSECPVQLSYRGNVDEDRVTVDVRDYGAGIQNEDMLDSILRSKSTSKINVEFYIGQYGHGGSTTFKFCPFTLIFTRHLHSDTVNVAAVMKCAPYDHNFIEGEEQRYMNVYMTLLDPATGKPFQFDAYDGNGNEIFEPGTFVRHFGYDVDDDDLDFYKSQPRKNKSSLFKTMSMGFPYPIMPFGIFDRREGKSQSLSRRNTILGSFKDLEEDLYDNVEYANQGTVDIGQKQDSHATMHWFVLNEEAAEDGYLFRYTNYGYSGQVFLSGQTIEPVPTSVIREAGLPFLERSIMVFVDLDNLDDRVKNHAITATRESLDQGFRSTIYDRLTQFLEADQVIQKINEERRKANSTSDREDELANRLKEDFQEYLEGDQGEEIDDQIEDVTPVPSRDPPTFLDVKGNNRVVKKGDSFYIRFKTDAPSRYFESGNDTFKVESSDPSVVDTSSVAYSEDAHDKTKGHKSVVGLEASSEVPDGSQVKIKLTLEPDNGNELSDTVNCVVIDATKMTKGGGDQNKDGDSQTDSTNKVPDIEFNWLSSENPDDLKVLKTLNLTDEQGNPLESKVGQIVRNNDGSVGIYLVEDSAWISEAMKVVSGDATTNQRYSDYRDFFLNDYYGYHIGIAALNYVLVDDKDPKSPSPSDEDDTEFESVLKGVARSVCGYWKSNYRDLVKSAE